MQLRRINQKDGGSCVFSYICKVSVGMIVERIIIIIITIINIMSFMQDIYTYIPETNYVLREYSVTAILLLLLMVLISLVLVVNLLYFYFSTSRSNYGLDGPGLNPGGDEIFHPSRPALGPTQPPVQWVTGSFPGVKCGRGMLVTTHPLLVLLSWKSRAIPLPTLWATLGL